MNYEKDILEFWQKNKIFEKSVTKKALNGEYVFYDGPPFATGLPHYGHLVGNIIKDVIPRYKTMNGYSVMRKWGWDCHGLPIENLIEKKLNLKNKKEIEDFGIDKFNNTAKDSVMRYDIEWKKIIPRIGRFIDMEGAYKTMDSTYTESIWWAFKELYNNGLIYKGYKPMHICPRCETTLSNFEVTQGYKEIKDISVTVKFKLKNKDNIYLLAWTTTPWTLPGNVALAVNPKIDYVKISLGNKIFILAKNRLGIIKDKYKIIKTFKGKELIGLEYEPIFNYYKNVDLKNKENGFKVYGANFVNTEDGVGIVHIAPAFGADDMELEKKYNLPFIQHIGMDGKFKKEVTDFFDMFVKPKDDHQKTDIEIIKWLARNNKLFAKEKITHSYPHCWRCDTPLINYASSSWFIKVTKIKKQILVNNKKINWIPKYLQYGRFGRWIENSPDWAVSRSRYWGAPIPVWNCVKEKNNKGCGKNYVIGSIKELSKKIGNNGNVFYFVRHGESENNVLHILSDDKNKNDLTENGVKQCKISAEKLKKEKIDLIVSSPVLRALKSAEIMSKILNVKLEIDNEIREIEFGEYNNKKTFEYIKYWRDSIDNKSNLIRFTKKAPIEGENLQELKERMIKAISKINSKYKNKKIVIVTHAANILVALGAMKGMTNEKIAKKRELIKNGEINKIKFLAFPVNNKLELDLHRPYIDNVEFLCECGGVMKRIPEVFDCWFESGSMPYASVHYPFENKKYFEKNFPAEFVAEGIDQTRGWFYTLLVLSTGLFKKSPFKNVVVNGIVLSESGEKMSKRLKNYPDPMNIIDKYGADALRYYILSSPVVRAETINFSEKGVDEVYKKIILRLLNVFTFYKTYTKETKNIQTKIISDNVLDKWILAKIEFLAIEINKYMEKYEIDKATRPIDEFIEDLSTWYIRRSRDRFKNEKESILASATTKFVLVELSKIIAPFIPFIAEYIYKGILRTNKSVHLENYPNNKFIKKLSIIKEMNEIRKIISTVLEIRAKYGIKIRQPLSLLKLKTKNKKIKKELLELIKDEVNVKNIIYSNDIKEDVELETKITPELMEEGIIREFIRFVQNLRKNAGFMHNDVIDISIIGNNNEFSKILIKWSEYIVSKIKVKKIYLSDKNQTAIKEGVFCYNDNNITVKIYK